MTVTEKTTDGFVISALVAFSTGVVCLRFLPELPPPGLAWIVCTLAILGAWRYRRWKPAGVLLHLFIAGLSLATGVASLVHQQRLPAALEKQDIAVWGNVQGTVQKNTRGGRFDFHVHHATHQGRAVSAPTRIRLSAYDTALLPTERGIWRLSVRLKRPHGIVNPGMAFLYETWLFQARIGATGYVTAAETAPSPDTGVTRALLAATSTMRKQFSSYLSSHLSTRNAAVLSALSVGIREGLDTDDWQLLQDTGTIHLVAISGLHIGFVAILAASAAAFFWRCSATLCLTLPAPLAGASAAAATGTAYALIAGFSLPTRRALVMLLVTVLAMVLYRKVTPARLLATALALVLVIDPLAPLGASFWLSFVAVGVLVAMAIGTYERFHRAGGGFRSLCTLLRGWSDTQIWLLLGMAPVLLVAFQKLSLVAPVANMMVVPLVGMLVVPLSLLALVSWSLDIQWLAYWLARFASMVLDLCWDLLTRLANMPWAAIETAEAPVASLATAIAGLLLLGVGKTLPGRGVGLILMLPLFCGRPAVPDEGAFNAVVLDTGQGLSVVLRTRNHVLVYDAGAAYPGGFDLGEAALLPYLRQLGVRHVDTLVVSHGDIDHIGGARALSRSLPVSRFISSTPESERAPPGGVSCHWNQTWAWDGVGFEVLWPPPGLPYQGNDSSCVIRVSSTSGSMLLTGDIESAVEKALQLKYDGGLSSDVLLVPHHGSRTSSTDVFLDRVAPRLAVVSSGYRNRFQHPHEEITDRYHRRGVPLLNTADEGALTIRFEGGAIRLSGARSDRDKFWLERGRADFNAINRRVNNPAGPVVESLAPSTGNPKQ